MRNKATFWLVVGSVVALLAVDVRAEEDFVGKSLPAEYFQKTPKVWGDALETPGGNGQSRNGTVRRQDDGPPGLLRTECK